METLKIERFIKRPRIGMKCKIYVKGCNSHFFGEVVGFYNKAKTRTYKREKENYMREIIVVKELKNPIDISECDYIIQDENVEIK